MRPLACAVLLAGLSSILTTSAQAQPGRQRDNKPSAAGKPMSSDPKVLSAYSTFVSTVEGYAAEYEKNKQTEKARACYEEILRIVPDYPKAKEKVRLLTEQEYTADLKVVDVQANEEWQDSGISVVPGKPIRIVASGAWTISYTQKVGPAGIEIPGGMRDMNPGQLVGMIAATPRETNQKTFAIGEKLDTTPEHAGHLFLRMFSPAVKQNTGKLTVQISGTFERSK